MADINWLMDVPAVSDLRTLFTSATLCNRADTLVRGVASHWKRRAIWAPTTDVPVPHVGTAGLSLPISRLGAHGMRDVSSENFAVVNFCGFPRTGQSCNYVLYLCP